MTIASVDLALQATSSSWTQRWTAQAGPSSIFVAAKMEALRGWKVSKLDVKGAFLNASFPDDELILVQPPAQWVAWGVVEKGVV